MTEKRISKQIYRFLVVGTFNVFVDYTVLNLLYLFLDFSLFWSVFWGFISGGVVGYTLHSRWTFSAIIEGKKQEILKFSSLMAVSVFNLSLSELIIHFLVEVLSLNYNLAKLGAILITTSISFISMKFFIFKKTKAIIST